MELPPDLHARLRFTCIDRCCSGPGAPQAGRSSLTQLRPLCLQSVGCAGEVVLHEAPGEDYEKYAIEIRSVSAIVLVEIFSGRRWWPRTQGADEACCACCSNAVFRVVNLPLSSSGTARGCRHLRMPQSRRPGRLFCFLQPVPLARPDRRVKFRDSEELQTLDANRQSGGERSVSTILYLIALQVSFFRWKCAHVWGCAALAIIIAPHHLV